MQSLSDDAGPAGDDMRALPLPLPLETGSGGGA